MGDADPRDCLGSSWYSSGNKAVFVARQVPDVGGAHVVDGSLLIDQHCGPDHIRKAQGGDGVFTE